MKNFAFKFTLFKVENEKLSVWNKMNLPKSNISITEY